MTHCAILEQGTQNAKPSLAFNIQSQFGNVFIEIAADDFELIRSGLKGAMEKWDAAERGKTQSSAPTEPVEVEESLPEIPAAPPKPRQRPNRSPLRRAEPPTPEMPEAA